MKQSLPKRYLGLELAGAKNSKTTLAVIEHYAKENKTFLLDVYEKLGASDAHSSDETLLETIHEAGASRAKLAVNIPIDLPACIGCIRRSCPMPNKCVVPEVRWMRDHRHDRDFTPYTQRPVELWIRNEVLPELDTPEGLEVDEALGGNKAPLSARMHFLKRHLKKTEIVEVWPKLSVALLSQALKLPKRFVIRSRDLEQGPHARMVFLEALSEKRGIFIYERDARKLSQNLGSFDAFICAYTALLVDQNLTVRPPRHFPKTAAWVHYPNITSMI